VRRPFTKHKRRIHATDPYFEELRTKSISLLNSSDVTILSVFQLVQEIPYDYFDKHGLDFDKIYTELLKVLFKELSLQEYRRVRIVIDSRKHPGGVSSAELFQQNIDNFLKNEFAGTQCSFLSTPSYVDILVELADFVSNTFYKSYWQNENEIFSQLGVKLIQIKNPL